jgi:hypothetical protein
MRAKVQGRFPFLGKMRSPGDFLTEEELAQTTPTVRDALVGQKLIVLDPSEGADDLASLAERVTLLEGLVNDLISQSAPKPRRTGSSGSAS